MNQRLVHVALNCSVPGGAFLWFPKRVARYRYARRDLVVLVMILALAGCRSQQASLADPFMGQTRVPPPSTGAAQARPGSDPYYANPSGAGVAKPLMPVPQGTAPAPVQTIPPSGYTPSPSPSYRSGPTGPYNYRGSAVEQTHSLGTEGTRVRVPPPALSVQPREPAAEQTSDRSTAVREWSQPIPKTNIVSRGPADAASSAAADVGPSDTNIDRSARAASYEGPTNLLAGRQRIVQTIPPRPRTAADASRPTTAAASGTSVNPQPRLLPLPQRATDIMDLPATKSKAAASASAGSDTFSAYARYGHGAEYEWLRGKLEYSQIDRRWKLRYIPIDGQTDDYGGSVVLADASLLEGLERGDFLEVRGKLNKQASGAQDYAPLYEVAQVKRLGN